MFHLGPNDTSNVDQLSLQTPADNSMYTPQEAFTVIDNICELSTSRTGVIIALNMSTLQFKALK